MNNRGLIRYVFASSHTSQGFYTFIPELINDLAKVFILKGAPGSGKSTFIRLLGEMVSAQGYEVEFWISAMDSVTPDGVYIPQLNLAVINGSLPESIDPSYPGARDHLINLDEYWERASVEQHRREIIELVDQVKLSREQAKRLLQEAAAVKAEIRQINSVNLNPDKLGQLLKELTAEILEKQPGEKHYFAEAFTADGLVDYINELSKACQKRYIFKGPSGTGKSMLINELAQQAKLRGYFLEYYHTGLEADTLAMVIIRNLQIALIESGNAELPLKPWDVIVDLTAYMNREANPGSHEGINVYYRNLESLLLAAQHELEKCQQTNRELKKIYTAALDFAALDRIRQELMDEIMRNKP